MKKFILFTVLIFIFIGMINGRTSNIIKIHDIYASPKDTILVEIEIINDDYFRSFGLTIPIPDGFAYVDGSLILNPERITNHQIYYNLSKSQIIIGAFSIDGSAFLENNGNVATLKFHTPNNEGKHLLDIIGPSIYPTFGFNNIVTDSTAGFVYLGDKYKIFDLVYKTDGNGYLIKQSLITEIPRNQRIIKLEVPYGEDGVLIKAEPNIGYRFHKWDDDIFDNPRVDKNIISDIEVTAMFNPEKYEIISRVNNRQFGYVLGDGIYTYGEEITLIAIPYDGYRFLRWGEEELKSTTNPKYTFVVTGNKTIIAYFIKN